MFFSSWSQHLDDVAGRRIRQLEHIRARLERHARHLDRGAERQEGLLLRIGFLRCDADATAGKGREARAVAIEIHTFHASPPRFPLT